MFYSSWNGFLPFLPSCLPPCLPSVLRFVLVLLCRCAFSFSSCLVSFHFSCLPFTPFFLRFFVPSFIALFLPPPPATSCDFLLMRDNLSFFDAIKETSSAKIRGIHIHKKHFFYIHQTKLLTIKTVSITIDLAYFLKLAVWGSVDLSGRLAPGSFWQSSGMVTKRRHSREASMRVPMGSRGLKKIPWQPALGPRVVTSRAIQGWNFTQIKARKKKKQLKHLKNHQKVGGGFPQKIVAGQASKAHHFHLQASSGAMHAREALPRKPLPWCPNVAPEYTFEVESNV